MCCFYPDNSKLLIFYQGFSKLSNFLSKIDQTGLSVSIPDRDPHQSSNTGSHRLIISAYFVGTCNTENSCFKNILSHRIWWHSKILQVSPPFRFCETKWKHSQNRIRSLGRWSCLMSTLQNDPRAAAKEKENETHSLWNKLQRVLRISFCKSYITGL